MLEEAERPLLLVGGPGWSAAEATEDLPEVSGPFDLVLVEDQEAYEGLYDFSPRCCRPTRKPTLMWFSSSSSRSADGNSALNFCRS